MLAEGRSTDIAKGGPSTAYCGRAHKAPHGTRLKSGTDSFDRASKNEALADAHRARTVFFHTNHFHEDL